MNPNDFRVLDAFAVRYSPLLREFGPGMRAPSPSFEERVAEVRASDGLDGMDFRKELLEAQRQLRIGTTAARALDSQAESLMLERTRQWTDLTAIDMDFWNIFGPLYAPYPFPDGFQGVLFALFPSLDSLRSADRPFLDRLRLVLRGPALQECAKDTQDLPGNQPGVSTARRFWGNIWRVFERFLFQGRAEDTRDLPDNRPGVRTNDESGPYAILPSDDPVASNEQVKNAIDALKNLSRRNELLEARIRRSNPTVGTGLRELDGPVYKQLLTAVWVERSRILRSFASLENFISWRDRAVICLLDHLPLSGKPIHRSPIVTEDFATECRRWLRENTVQLDTVEEISLSGHSLFCVPREVGLFRNLRTLDLSRNGITGLNGVPLPASLTRLNLSHNWIRRLPPSVLELYRQGKVDVRQNLFDPFYEKFCLGGQNVCNFLAAREMGMR